VQPNQTQNYEKPNYVTRQSGLSGAGGQTSGGPGGPRAHQRRLLRQITARGSTAIAWKKTYGRSPRMVSRSSETENQGTPQKGFILCSGWTVGLCPNTALLRRPSSRRRHDALAADGCAYNNFHTPGLVFALRRGGLMAGPGTRTRSASVPMRSPRMGFRLSRQGRPRRKKGAKIAIAKISSTRGFDNLCGRQMGSHAVFCREWF